MGALRELLVFELDGQRFGLPLSVVREVVRAVAITPLPNVPPIIEGVINVRGRVIPVLDLRARFALPPRTLIPEEHLVLARADARLVAIRTDRVTHFQSVDERDIEDPAQITPRLRRIEGVAKLDDGLILIHDLETFLTHAEAEAVAHALDGGKG